jgi:hypothetical protein
MHGLTLALRLQACMTSVATALRLVCMALLLLVLLACLSVATCLHGNATGLHGLSVATALLLACMALVLHDLPLACMP